MVKSGVMKEPRGENMQSARQLCRQCEGKSPTEVSRCSCCGGTGWVAVLLPTGACPHCLGTGRRVNGKLQDPADCECCFGTGWIRTRDVKAGQKPDVR